MDGNAFSAMPFFTYQTENKCGSNIFVVVQTELSYALRSDL